MITERFSSRTIANMEVALERACLLLPADSEKHRTRRRIANNIIECANRGDTTLGELTEAGYAAAKQLTQARARRRATAPPRLARPAPDVVA